MGGFCIKFAVNCNKWRRFLAGLIIFLYFRDWIECVLQKYLEKMK